MSALARTMWLAACAWFAFAPGCAAEADPAREAPPAEVVLRRVAHECFTSLVHASGYLVPRRSAVVMFAASGYRITEVRVNAGDTVRRGDVVARAVPANPMNVNPPNSDPPANPPRPAQDVSIVSLASGTILQSTAVVGMSMTALSKPLFTIAVDGVIEAAVSVPSVHLGELKAGQVTRVMTGDGSVLDGRVRRVSAIVEAASQMGTARLSIRGSDRIALSGFVTAAIEARRSCGIGVPMAALRRSSAGASVQVLKGDVIESRVVTLGLANDTDSEVTSGLAEGDVVVAGTGSSREGDRVTPVFADPQDGR